MGKLLLSLLLFATAAQGQTLPELIKSYEAYCGQTASDTVTQYGTVSYDVVPVLDKAGKIIHYALGRADTVWQKPDCPEFKYPDRSHFTISAGSYFHSGITLTGYASSGPITATTTQEKTTVEIERKYVCEVKLREVEPFSPHFWEWVKKPPDAK